MDAPLHFKNKDGSIGKAIYPRLLKDDYICRIHNINVCWIKGLMSNVFVEVKSVREQIKPTNELRLLSRFFFINPTCIRS